MALGNVSFNIQSGNLGALLSFADGVAGYVLTGVSAGDITAGTPFKITSLEDAVELGLAEATNAFAYKVIKEHYDECPAGTDTYVMLVADTMTVNLMADKTNANGARKLLDFADGNIRLLGIMALDDSPTVTNGLDANVYTAKTNLQALAVEYAGVTKQAPFWGFIGGTSFSGVDSALTNQNNSTDDYVTICIGDTEEDSDSCCLGLFVGRKAADTVERSGARVRTGAVNITGGSAWIADTLVEKSTIIGGIHDKGFCTLRKFVRKNGYFFTPFYTCTSATSDFKRGERRHIMNKVQIIAYAVAVEEIEETVPTEPTTGLIDPSYAKYLESEMEKQINGIMVASGELSAFECIVDLNQNVVSTEVTKFKLKPTPVGYNKSLEGTLAFSNPASGS